jgi:hypothetical protein
VPIANSCPACCLLRLLLDGADNLICSRPDWYGVPGIVPETFLITRDNRTEVMKKVLNWLMEGVN